MARKDGFVDHLAQLPLFWPCSKKDLRLVASKATPLDIPAGRTIIEEGSPGKEFFVIDSGSAVVKRNGRKVPRSAPAAPSASWPCSTAAPHGDRRRRHRPCGPHPHPAGVRRPARRGARARPQAPAGPGRPPARSRPEGDLLVHPDARSRSPGKGAATFPRSSGAVGRPGAPAGEATSGRHRRQHPDGDRLRDVGGPPRAHALARRLARQPRGLRQHPGARPRRLLLARRRARARRRVAGVPAGEELGARQARRPPRPSRERRAHGPRTTGPACGCARCCATPPPGSCTR